LQSSGLVLARPLHRLASRDFARDPPSYITLDQGATRDRDKPFTSFQKKTENAEVAKEVQNRKAHKGEKRKKEKKVGIARIWKRVETATFERRRKEEVARKRKAEGFLLILIEVFVFKLEIGFTSLTPRT
jgi:hypothetical protein